VVAFLLGEGLAGQRSPADLPGLYLWYKADSITPAADTEIVTRWDDAGPNKLALDEPSGSPTLVAEAIGRLPAVRFQEGGVDGLRTSKEVSALEGNPSFTIFLVARIARSERVHVQALGWGDGAA